MPTGTPIASPKRETAETNRTPAHCGRGDDGDAGRLRRRRAHGRGQRDTARGREQSRKRNDSRQSFGRPRARSSERMARATRLGGQPATTTFVVVVYRFICTKYDRSAAKDGEPATGP